MAAEAVTAPLWGPAGDRYGRRPIIIVLEFFFGFFGVAMGFAENIYLIVMLRGCREVLH